MKTLFGWKSFNDRLAIFLLSAILVLWAFQAALKWQLPSEVNGVLIAAFMLILQFYFRKAPPENTDKTNPPTLPGG